MTDESIRIQGNTDRYRCQYCGLDMAPVAALASLHYVQAHDDEPEHRHIIRELYGERFA